MKISMILNVALGIALVFLCYLVTIGKGKEKGTGARTGTR